jgi:hypothetical protein
MELYEVAQWSRNASGYVAVKDGFFSREEADAYGRLHFPVTGYLVRVQPDGDDAPECEGHYDYTLMSGAGIGEPTYCDGSCVA